LANALAALDTLDLTSLPLRKSAPEPPTAAAKIPEKVPSLPPEKSPSAAPDAARYKWTGREVPDQAAAIKEAKAVVLLKGYSAWVTAIAFSPDRHTLASGAVHGAARLWDLSGSKPCEKAILKTVPEEIHSLAFAGNRILAMGCGSLEGFVWLWDLAGLTPKNLATLQGHKSPVEALAFSKDNRFLASGGCDKAVILWEIAGPQSKELAVFKGHTENVQTLAFSPDGKTLVSASLDGTIRFWRRGSILSKDLLAVLEGDWGPVYTIAFSPDGRYLAFGSLDQTIRLFSLSGPQFREKSVLRGHLGVVRQIHFNPEGNLISVCDGGRVIAWNVTSGAKGQELQLPKAKVCSVAFTVDGRYLAAGTSDGVVKIFRIYERKEESG
jgi:WD40 repeat protein